MNRTLLTLVTMLLVSAWAYADVPAPGKLMVGDVKVNALVDTYFANNFNTPPLSTNPATAPQSRLRAFDVAHEQFQLNSAQVGFSHDAHPVGFDVVLGFGTAMDALHGVDGATDAQFRNLRKATVSWKHDAWMVTAGKMDVNFGLEKIESIDNWNYSRSFQFSLMQPWYQNGLTVGYDLGDGWGAMAGVANGNNRTNDNNRGKTYDAKFGYSSGGTSVGLSWVGGPEIGGNSVNWRNSVGLNAKHTYNDSLATGLDATFVKGTNEALDTVGDRGTATRYGASLYGMVGIFSDAWETLRLEWVKDSNGAATQTNTNVNLWGITATHRSMITKNFSLWLEGRYDNGGGTNAFFDSNGVVNKTGQTTVLGAATFNI